MTLVKSLADTLFLRKIFPSPWDAREFRLLLMTCCLYFACLGCLLQLPRLVMTQGGTATDAGLLAGLTLFPDVLLSPVAAFLVTRTSARILISFGLATTLAAIAGMAAVSEPGPLFYGLRLLQGVGHAFAYVPMFATAYATVPGDHKALGLARFAIAVQMGNLLGAPLGATLFVSAPPNVLLGVTAALAGVAMVPAYRLRGEPQVHPAQKTRRVSQQMAQVLRFGPSALATTFVAGGVFCGATQFVPAYFDELERLGRLASPQAAIAFMAATFAFMVVCRLLIGHAGDGRYRRLLANGSCMLVVGSIVWVAHVDCFTDILIGGAAFGVGYGLLYPTIMALMLRLAAAEEQQFAAGILATSFQYGYLSLPFLLGPLIDALGYSMALLCLAASLFIAWGAFLTSQPPLRQWLVPEKSGDYGR